MTTNTIDKRNRVLASDSRWSVADGEHLLFVDDTGFDKIMDRTFGSIICAGHSLLIDEWRNWWSATRPDFAAFPRTHFTDVNGQLASITLSVVQKPDCMILATCGQYEL